MATAATQSRIASLNINKGPLSPLEPPPATPLVKDLLEKNNKEHDILFGKDHFHNHFPHAMLSQFALGAPETRLKKEWQLEDYLRPLPEKQATEVTDSNWKEFIGIDKYYPNYLDYFKDKIAQDGVGKTVVKYALDETLLPSFVSGAVHPLIHTGFGLEFGQDIVVAEGLSEACVHKPAFAPVVDIQKYSIKSTSGKDILSIVKEVQKDPLFDDVVTFKDFPKSDPVLKNKKATDRIKEYVMQWKIVESEEGYAKAWTELFEFTTHSTCSSAFPPPHITNDPKYKGKQLRPVLDFFLMYLPLHLTYLFQAYPNRNLRSKSSPAIRPALPTRSLPARRLRRLPNILHLPRPTPHSTLQTPPNVRVLAIAQRKGLEGRGFTCPEGR